MNYEVANVKCENCVNLIKNSLQDEFGKIEINLSKEPRILSIDLKEEQKKAFENALAELGFNVIREL